MKIQKELKCKDTGVTFKVSIDYKFIDGKVEITGSAKPVKCSFIDNEITVPEDVKVEAVTITQHWIGGYACEGSCQFRVEHELIYYKYNKRVTIFIDYKA